MSGAGVDRPAQAGTEALRIGVFGGSFDPPHNAHVSMAQAAIAQLRLNELRVVPTGVAWHKTRRLTAPEDRLAMTRLAFADIAKVVIDDRELKRAGPTFTIETLTALLHENQTAQLYLIMGSDQFAAFRQWHQWEAILEIAIICVAERAINARASGLFDSHTGQKSRFVSLAMPSSALSATQVRQLYADTSTDGEDMSALVPSAVARYIADHALYKVA